MPKKYKKIVIAKSKIFLSLYVVSIIFVVGIFALQSGNAYSETNYQGPITRLDRGVKVSAVNQVIEDIGKTNNTVGSGNTSASSDQLLPIEPDYSYEVISKSANPRLSPGGKGTLTLKIKNNGNTTWLSNGQERLFLGASRPFDRDTVFYKEGENGWYSGNRIKMEPSSVRPGRVAIFTFEIVAPEKSGVYREFFTPLLENSQWLEDKGIYWDIEVRNPDNPEEELAITVSGKPIKYIEIKLDEQFLYAYEDGLVKYRFQTSTGRVGMDTPTGEFEIYNKFPVQYSAPYELYMDNWMAITSDGAYGVHSLPYWLLRAGGRLYEGEEHLGTKVSHGCIRLSLENSKLLFDWAEVGTLVHIED